MNWLTKARAGLVGGAMIAAIAAGTMTSAQTVPDTAPPPPVGLDIPANVQIFGKVDPNVRKPTAIVNGVVITGTDVDQRGALIIAANQLTNLTPEDMNQLKLQVLRALMDETLEIQHAKTNEITVTADEINQSVVRVAANFGKSPAEFNAFLRSVGSSDRSLRRQIEGELAWRRYLQRRVEPLINVGDEEVKAILARMTAAKGSEEFHLKEIYLSAGPDRAQQVFAQERQMIADIQAGTKPFDYYAQFSEASTRSKLGDLDWLNASQLTQLPDSLANQARIMKPGEIAGPIEVPGGFSILYLVDKRRVLEADPRDSTLTLKQLSVKFAAGLTEADAKARLQAFATATQAIHGCGDVSKVATAMGAEVVDNAQVRVRDLPVPLQKIMLELQVGQSTPPFGSVQEGIRSLVLCGRDEAREAALPTSDQIQGQQEQLRVNRRAEQLLRDLRRDAIIEYR
ncbi:MAG: peptidylprolyl isomerase [Sphingomonas bacterium]|nr:peptidylprolyl isomerase [Sphingomonas bacterium]